MPAKFIFGKGGYLPNHVYFVTSTTVVQQKLFMDFNAGCAAARCFEDTAVL